jgi:hypothetical protein
MPNNSIPIRRCMECGAVLTSALMVCSCASAHAEPHPEPVLLSPPVVKPLVTQVTTKASWDFTHYKILTKN